MRLKKRLIRGITYYGLSVIIYIVYQIPSNISVRIGGILGKAAYYILYKEKRKTLKNLSLSFPEANEKEIRKIGRACFSNLGKGLFELINLPKLNKDNIDRIVNIEGEEYINHVLKKGKGYIFVTGHIGNWELMGAAFGMKGYKVNVIAAPLYDSRINELLIKQRAFHNVRVIQRGAEDVKREIIKALHNNESLTMLIDQDTKVPGVFVDFFGRKAYTPSGAASIAMRTGAPVLMGFIKRLPDNTHKIQIKEPLKLINSGNKDADIEANTALFTKMIESEIKKDPDQWVWMHNRWKKSPEKLN